MTAQRQIAVIGNGRMGEIYAAQIAARPDARVAAVVGNRPEKTEAFAKRFGAKAYSGGRLDQLLAEMRSEIDGYILAAPEWVRMSELTLLATEQKPLLIEKPLVSSLDDLRKLESLFVGKTNLLNITHSLRATAKFNQTFHEIKSGAVGEVRHMYARRNGSSTSVLRVLGKTPLAYWLTCHDVDVMRWYAGSEIASVRAITRNKLASTDDYLIVHLRFRNGVDAIDEVSWCSPSLSSTAPGCVFTVTGTKGQIQVEDTNMGVAIYREGDTVSQPDTFDFFNIQGTPYGTHFVMIDQWLRGFDGRTPNKIGSFADAKAAVEICALIEKSVKTGKEEFIEDLR